MTTLRTHWQLPGCCILLLSALLPAAVAAANAGTPLLKSLYPGSRMVWQKQNKYVDSISLLLSTPFHKGDQLVVSKVESVKGALDVAVFEHQPSDSEIELHASYRQALIQQGFTIRFDCVPDCAAKSGYANWSELMKKYAPPVAEYSVPITHVAYIAASKGNVHVMVLTGGEPSGDPPTSVVAAITSKPMNVSGIEINTDYVSASDIASRLQQDGRIALYGVHFDTGRADIKPQSRALLDQIAGYLKQNAAARLYVVGHTDDVGALQANLELSDKRAAAVVADLVQRSGISAARLTARGVGPLAPLAGNKTEQDRGRNRRVELIEKVEKGR